MTKRIITLILLLTVLNSCKKDSSDDLTVRYEATTTSSTGFQLISYFDETSSQVNVSNAPSSWSISFKNQKPTGRWLRITAISKNPGTVTVKIFYKGSLVKEETDNSYADAIYTL